MLDFNTSIEYPEDIAQREGFTFTGWSPRPERMPAENTTVKAQWDITNPTEYVEIVFSEKDLSGDEIREIIKTFVPEGTEFTVEKVESDSEETTAIVKFIDREAARNFVEAVSTSSGVKKVIKVRFISEDISSFSFALNLNAFAYFMSHFLSF